jgi:hypothetical protein
MVSLWNGMRIAMALSIRDGVRRNPGLYLYCRRDVWKMGKERIARREEGSETQEPSRLSHEQIRICRVFPVEDMSSLFLCLRLRFPVSVIA